MTDIDYTQLRGKIQSLWILNLVVCVIPSELEGFRNIIVVPFYKFPLYIYRCCIRNVYTVISIY